MKEKKKENNNPSKVNINWESPILAKPLSNPYKIRKNEKKFITF